MKIQIKPIIKTINFLEISNISIVIDAAGRIENRAQIYVKLTGDITESKLVDLTTEEYAAWGEDDNYLLGLVISKLGLEKA
jgi:hypothetical protein